MSSRHFATALAVALAGVLCAPAGTSAATSTTTVVRIDGGCGWAGGTWHFDGVTGAIWRSGGYAWCVSPVVTYSTSAATTTTVTVSPAWPAYYPYAAASYHAWAAYPYAYAPYGVAVRGAYGGYAATTGAAAWSAGSVSGVSRAGAAYNPWTGNAGAVRGTARYDAATGTYAAGQQGGAYNRYSGDYGYGERGAAYNERTGVAVAGSHGTVGNASTGNAVSGGRAVAYDPRTGQATRVGGVYGENGGVGHVGNDWYVGRNGEVRQLGGGTRQRATGTNRQRPQRSRRR